MTCQITTKRCSDPGCAEPDSGAPRAKAFANIDMVILLSTNNLTSARSGFHFADQDCRPIAENEDPRISMSNFIWSKLLPHGIVQLLERAEGFTGSDKRALDGPQAVDFYPRSVWHRVFTVR